MTNRILIGKFPTGDSSPNGYGVRVSQPGYDVTTANPDNQKLIFNSDWQDVLALAADANGNALIFSQDASSGGTVYTYTHSLNYIPFVAAFVNVNGQGWENYHSSNMLLSKYVDTAANQGETIGRHWFSNQNDKRSYSFEGSASLNGTAVPHVQIKVTTTTLSCMCTVPAKFYVLIYKAKAFD